MKETMTSRQRVKNAIEHKPIDRFPIDLSVHFSTGISAFAYYNLRKFLGLDYNNIEMADCNQLLGRVDDDIYERFHIDTVLLNPRWSKTHRWNPRGEYVFNVPEDFHPEKMADGSWQQKDGNNHMIMPEGGFFFDGGWSDFFNLPEDEKNKLFARRAEMLAKETDKIAMMMGYWGFYGGIDHACEMLVDPESCIESNERALKDQIARFDRMNKSMGPYVHSIEINSDLGSQHGLMCTPQSYEQVCFPVLKRFCDHVKQTSDIKIFLHSCGAVSELIPFFIEAGIDALNPVQISASGMDPAKLKKQFGDKICFWGGGCDTQVALWSYTSEQIKTHVKELTDIWKPGGGFVFNQVHNIMGNVPPENIIAMFDTAYENSWY